MGSGGIEQRGGAGLPASLPVRAGDVVLGKYAVERVLGQGGMGTVVAVRHTGTGERYAVKILSPKALVGPQVVERFMREARAVERLKGEHVAKVYEIGRLEGGSPCMVMDLLTGSDLQELVQKRGALVLDQAVDYVLQASEGVAEAHSLGIIHRDLKPANLFLTWLPDRAPCVKVLDFGIAKHVGLDGPDGAELTRTGMVFGSPAYMSPEQMKHTKNADARSDVWSMGVVLYQLVTGTLPFFSEAILELAVKVAVDAPVRPSRLRPEVPAALDEVILRCLEKNPERRFQTMRDLMAALSAVRTAPDTSTLLHLPPTQPAPAVAGTRPDRALLAEASTALADARSAPQDAADSAAKTMPLPAGGSPPASARAAPILDAASQAADSDAITPRADHASAPAIGTTTGLGVADTEAADGSAAAAPGLAVQAIREARLIHAAGQLAPPIPADPLPTLLSPGAALPRRGGEAPHDAHLRHSVGHAAPVHAQHETATLPGRPAPPASARAAPTLAERPTPEGQPAYIGRPAAVPVGPAPAAAPAVRDLPSIWDTASPGDETQTGPPMPSTYLAAPPVAAGRVNQRISSPGIADRPSGTFRLPAAHPSTTVPAGRHLQPIVIAGASAAVIIVTVIVLRLWRGGEQEPRDGGFTTATATAVSSPSLHVPPSVSATTSGSGRSPPVAPTVDVHPSVELPAPSATATTSSSARPPVTSWSSPVKGTATPSGTSTKPIFEACVRNTDCRQGKKCVQSLCK